MDMLLLELIYASMLAWVFVVRSIALSDFILAVYNRVSVNDGLVENGLDD